MKILKQNYLASVSLNRNKNIISRRVHNIVTHAMVIKTRCRANISYWTYPDVKNTVTCFR